MQYLIRIVKGHRPLVCPMRVRQLQDAWYFRGGVAVIDDSLSDGLMKAQKMLDRSDRHGFRTV